MSHFTTVQTRIHDVAALRAACSEMGLALHENAEARGFGPNTAKGDLVIRLKGPYDIALNRLSDGSYGLTADWWGGHVEKETGRNCGRLLQLYAAHKTRIEARRKGLTCRRQMLGDGSIKIIIGGL